MPSQKKQNESPRKTAKVLIVDDHPILRQGLAELIDHEEDLEVCAQAEDANQALSAIKKMPPDIAIVDIALKEASGVELIKDIKAQHPQLPVLALSMHEESLYAKRVLRAGATGYIMKQEATEDVIAAIRKVLTGQVYVSQKMTEKLMYKLVGRTPEPASAVESLSDRELEVFLLIGKGHSTRQIADKLFLSIKTIETYRAHLKEKLALDGSAQLLQYAIQWVNSHDNT